MTSLDRFENFFSSNLQEIQLADGFTGRWVTKKKFTHTTCSVSLRKIGLYIYITFVDVLWFLVIFIYFWYSELFPSISCCSFIFWKTCLSENSSCRLKEPVTCILYQVHFSMFFDLLTTLDTPVHKAFFNRKNTINLWSLPLEFLICRFFHRSSFQIESLNFCQSY